MISTLKHLFTPQKSNNHRPRLLHPMGLVVMIAFLLISNSAVEIAKLAEPTGFVLGYASDINADQVLQATNQERINNGLPPLTHSSQLSQAAAAKAQHMFAEDYWAHIGPSGVTPWEFIKNTGYRYSVAGENLARDFDTTSPMIQAWMDSPTHRANIVHEKYTETGVAVVNGTLDGIETTLVVQMFGKPVGVAATAPTPPPQIPQRAGSITNESLANAETAVETNRPEVLNANSQVTYQAIDQTKPVVSPLQVKKSVVLSTIVIIVAVLLIDEIIIRYRKTARFVGKNLAHIGFLLAVLFIVLTLSQPGGIL